MNLNQIVNMFLRVVMWKAIKSGVNAGARVVSRKSKKNRSPEAPMQVSKQMTDHEDVQRLKNRDAIRERRRARRAARDNERN